MKVVAHDERIRRMLQRAGATDHPGSVFIPHASCVAVAGEDMLFVTESDHSATRWWVTLHEIDEAGLRTVYDQVRNRCHLENVEVHGERSLGSETLCIAVAFLVRAGYLLTYYQLGSPRRPRGL